MKDWPWYYFVVLGVLILGLFYLLYYKPKNNELIAVRANRENTEQEVTQLRVKKKQMDELQIEVDKMDITLKELESIIPSKKEISDILNRTQQLAFDSSLDIKKFSPKGEVMKEFYSDWPIEIEIEGKTHNLAQFFARLSNFSRLFTVEDFAIRSLPSQTPDTTIFAKFTTQTYILREVVEKKQITPKTRR